MARAANDTRVVGKHTLESLTEGMYKKPFTIYREYIQNCSDAIDEALTKGIIKPGDAEIRIRIDARARQIVIRDNGIGVSKDKAYKTLGDIGNSQKSYEENRGFRGIGRLAGFTYARSVTFVTSYKGEPYRTIISFDCNQMRSLLRDSSNNDTAIEVLNRITDHRIEPDKPEEHYCEVILDGVLEQFDELLDVTQVRDYLAEVAPIPFDDQKFVYAKLVREKIKAIKGHLEEYNIYINNSSQPLRKPYKTRFQTGHRQSDRKLDRVTDIEFFEGAGADGKLLFFGWYGKTSLHGTVKDKDIRGLRIRKGNILIGNEFTCSQFFPEARLNGWLIGEVYVYGKNIIPNSQRDDFEENEAFRDFAKRFSEQARVLHAMIRNTSDLNSRINVIQEGETALAKIQKEIESGNITSEVAREQLMRNKEEVESRIEKAEKELKKIIEKIEDENAKQKVSRTLNKCNELKQKAIETENKIINSDYGTKHDLPTSYSRDEQKLYQRIIKVIYESLDSHVATNLRKRIIEELSRSNKGSRKKK